MKKIILGLFVFSVLFTGASSVDAAGGCSVHISASKTQLTSPETVYISYGAGNTWHTGDPSGCRTVNLRYNSDNDSGGITGDIYAVPSLSYSEYITKTTKFHVSGYDEAGTISEATVTITFTTPTPPAAPTVSINANPNSVSYGASSNISWSSSNATSCSVNGTSSNNTSGSFNTGNLYSNTTYTATCYGNGGQKSASTNVTVGQAPSPQAPTVNLTANPSTITAGSSSTLSWNSTNATSCSGISGSNTSGTKNTGALYSTQTYNITCYGNGGTAYDSVTVNVTPVVNPPSNPTVSVTANPSTVSYGGNSNISWSSNNATYCISSNGLGGTNTSGAFATGSLTTTQTYTVTCYNNSGNQASANATVTVNQITPPPYNPEPTVTLTANPSSVQQGNASTISWSSTNATSCSGISGSSTYGTFNTGALYSTTTYNIVCTGLGGSKSASVTVGVTSTPLPTVPTVTVTANPTNVQYGGTSFINWTSTNATYCYSSNGLGGTNTNGSFSTGSLTTTQTYTVICSGNGGVAQNQAIVTVGSAPVVNPTGTLTSSMNSCTIPNGSSTCNIFFVWNTMNPASGAVSAVVSNTGSTVGYGNNNSGSFNIPFGSITYYLYHNALELASKTVSASCANGTWNGSTCVANTPPVAPTVTVTANPTTVAYGGSSTVSWTSTNATSCNASQPNTSNGTTGNFMVTNLTNSQTYTVTCVNSTSGLSGSNSVSINVNGQVQAPTGTLTPSKPACTIAAGASTCNIFFVWNTSNPIGVSQVLKYGSSNPVGTGNNSSGEFAIPFEGATYALYNNGNELSTKYVNAVCPTTAPWNGTICATNVVTPPTVPTVTVTANPTTVVYGGSSTVSWTSTNASYCSSSSLSGGTSTTGQFTTPSLTSSTTYVVTCTNSTGGTGTGSVSIGVGNQPVMSGTLTSSADSCIIPSGASSCKISFSWTTTNPVGTSQVMRYGINSPVGYGNNNSGLFSVYFDGDIFALYNNANTLAVKSVDASCASGTTWNGSICASGTTTGTNVCTINNFSANTTQIYQSQAVVLSWNTSNCTNVNISGIGSVNLSSSGQTVYPSVSTTYNINATGPNGSDYDSVFVSVNNNNNNNYCTIYSFSSNANSVQAGSPVILTWNTNNCTSVSISGIGSVALSGSTPVYPSGSTTYTVTAYGINGNDTEYLTVNTNTYVPPAPQPPSVYNSCAVSTIATNITSNSAQVHGLVSGSSYANTNTYFEYGPTPSLGTRTVSRSVYGNNLFNDFLYNLSPNTIYYFRSVADCQNGTSYGALVNFRTGNTVGIPTGPTTYYNNNNTNTNTTTTIRQGTTVIGTSSPIMLRIENKYEALGIGDTVDYAVYYKNIGSSLLTRPILQVIAPAGIELTNASRGTYSALTNTLTVQLEDLYPNQEGVVYVQGIVRDVPINNANIVTTAVLVYTNPNGAQENAMAYVLNHSREFYNSNNLGASAFFGWFGGIGLIGWLLIIIFILLLILLIRSFFYNRRSVTTVNDGHGGTTHTTITH